MSFRLHATITLLAATVLAGGTSMLSAQATALPPSALPGAKSVDTIERMVMPEVDVETLLAEDAVRERAGRPVPTRYGKGLQVVFTPANSGAWEELDDGSHLWRLLIASPGALSLSLGLARFDLPAGAAFWVHDPDGAWVQGPYTAENRNALGGLWTAVVLGDELVAELRVPANDEADLVISTVTHGYRFFGERKTAAGAKRGACNINVVCPQGDAWRNQIRSVAGIGFSSGGDSFVCSAQLVNNTAEDGTPYLLTAQHCIDSAEVAPTIVAYWNYETTACDDAGGGDFFDFGNWSQNQSGATFVASYPIGSGSDFALVELDAEPDPSYNVYYSGWDARDAVPASATTIHHPVGGPKSISLDSEPPTITSYLQDASPGDGNYLRIGDWDEGTTEGGSSGACLFDDATGLCIGTLSGGHAARGNDLPDWYGRLARDWTGDGTPETRLSDWLDPLGGGDLFFHGKNAGGSGDETWLIPAVASLAGEPPSNWKSQLAVANPSAETRTASIFFVADGQAWPGGLLSGPHAVAPNASLYIDDPLLAENPTSGLMYVTVDGPGTAVFVRTYNLVPDGTTFGQGQPGIPLGETASSTELVLPMVHSAPSVFRTNVGFAQTSAGAIQVSVEIYSAAGTLLAQKTYSQAAAWRQIYDVFDNMGIGTETVEGGWIRVTLVTGSPAFWTTYATVIDDRTDDPTYVLPVAP